MFKKTFLIISFISVITLFIGIFKGFAIENKINNIFNDEKLVKSESLQEIRGGYKGIYFQVIFTGYWDDLGHDVSIEGGNDFIGMKNNQDTSDFSKNTVSSSGVKVKSFAIIGNFNGANGIFQINQVPGSNNIVRNNLIININIFNDQEPPTKSLNEMFGNMPLNL